MPVTYIPRPERKGFLQSPILELALKQYFLEQTEKRKEAKEEIKEQREIAKETREVGEATRKEKRTIQESVAKGLLPPESLLPYTPQMLRPYGTQIPAETPITPVTPPISQAAPSPWRVPQQPWAQVQLPRGQVFTGAQRHIQQQPQVAQERARQLQETYTRIQAAKKVPKPPKKKTGKEIVKEMAREEEIKKRYPEAYWDYEENAWVVIQNSQIMRIE